MVDVRFLLATGLLYRKIIELSLKEINLKFTTWFTS